MKPRSGLGVASALLALLVGVPARAPAAPLIAHIQPGAPLTDPTLFPDNTIPYSFHRCTMGFILADRNNVLYMVTAGHCVTKKRARTYDETSRVFGTVVFQLQSGTDDMALVKIDRGRYKDVSPSVRDWGGPTGVATPATAKANDQLKFSGFSFLLGDIALTRARTGVLVKQSPTHYMADTTASEGDSGAPFIDARTGQAIGIVRDFGLTDSPPVTDDGPTLQRILSIVAKAGYRLYLKTARYAG
ncbi:MAG TPA: trypsin-like peptidase domain-containing protein [Actinomycetota bacterium]|nr:trypsin-like peptidase domain-containing protein [Actinomycetota bacterium]